MGLTNQEVLESRKKYGSNVISNKHKNSFLKLLLESFSDPIIKILLIALAIKVVFLFKSFDWFETLGILIAVFLASFISSISEYGSEMAFLKMQEDSKNITVKTIRENKVMELSINSLVVNDVIILSSGDRVPADVSLLSGSLDVDESTINGETKEVQKQIGSTIYRGSIVYNGYAKVK